MAVETVQNKVAVVTGAASGIGLGMTRALAGAGAHVAMLDVEENALAKSHAEFDDANFDVRRYRCDVSDVAQVEEVASRVRDDFGGVHIVCNNAGVGAGGPIDEATRQDWQWVRRQPVRRRQRNAGVCADRQGHRQGRRRRPRRQHRLGHGHVDPPRRLGSVYSASKYAVVAISEATREELAPFHIGVSALCPYIVDTRILQSGRNRPAEYGAPRPHGGAEAERRAEEMAQLFSRGISIDGIGEMVLNGIRRNKAYIFTHASTKERIRARFDRIVADFDGTELAHDP